MFCCKISVFQSHTFYCYVDDNFFLQNHHFINKNHDKTVLDSDCDVLSKIKINKNESQRNSTCRVWGASLDFLSNLLLHF